MKKLTLFVTTLVVAVLGFGPKLFAIEPETEVETSSTLTQDLYLSEVSGIDEKYIEIYINNQFEDNDYFIMTESALGALSTGFYLYELDETGELSEQQSDNYYALLTIPSGLSLANPSPTRTVYICKGVKSSKDVKENCSFSPIDEFEYSSLPNKSTSSWSRDFNSEDLKIKESRRTPGEENNFDITDESNNGDDDPDDQDPDDEVEEASMCSSLSLNEISFSDQEKFIEIINTTPNNINLNDCALRRGTSRSFVNIDGTISPGEIKSYDIAGSSLTQTNSGVNIHIYDSTQDKNVVTVAYKARSATSYAFLEVNGIEGWYSTYAMTPGQENIYQSYPNCEVGYHLNTATNKCNKNPEPPAECAEGQFRNPETGRCKKYPESTVLAECPEGQYRNPATNRCKKIATEDDLIPCAEGYERNPETNRCRKIRSVGDAEYAVEPYGVSDENRTWVTIGIATMAGLGLIITFQFRHEIAIMIRKLIRKK